MKYKNLTYKEKPFVENTFILKCRDYPGDPVIRTWWFYCQGPGAQSLVWELRSLKLHSMAKKKKLFKKCRLKL